MEAFLNPNVAYVMLVISFILAILALLSPGTGMLELGALFALVLSGYIISSLPFNWWAFPIFIAAFVGLFFAVRIKTPKTVWTLLAVSFVLLLAGSAFLFDFTNGGLAVHPLLNVSLSLIVVSLTWWVARKTLEAFESHKAFDLDRIVGMVGRADTDIQTYGSVYVNGENWTAISTTFIPTGSQVRVIRRQGLQLEVEPLSSDTAHS